ncbi:MAG: sulfotransferase [Fimbriimonas sp.]|nr:sulfotransferase [Fimbriimonas sp.]
MPTDIDQLEAQALSCYRAGRFPETEQYCRHIVSEVPDHVQATILLGLVAAKTGRPQPAIDMLRKATALDPTSYDAHVWLANLMRITGNIEEAIRCGETAVKLDPDGAAGFAALGLARMANREFHEAAALFERAAEIDPKAAPIQHNLGKALQVSGRTEEAVRAFQNATALAPRNPESFISLAHVCFEIGDRMGAAAAFRRAHALEPHAPRGMLQLAKAEIHEGEIDRAERTLKQITRVDPSMSTAYGLLGNVLQQQGKFVEAGPILRKAIELQPNVARPYFDLVNCQRIARIDRELVDRMQSLLDSGIPNLEDRRHLHYGIGKALADLGEFEPAMQHYDAANRVMDQLIRHPFDVAAHSKQVDLLIEAFSDGRIDNISYAHYSERPVFIVGMIRSGTTLVEQIVSSHPAAVGGGELLYWQERAEPLFGDGFLAMEAEQLHAIGIEFLQLLNGINGSVQRVTDKMPLNYIYMGIINSIFPNARFIHCRRNPIDTCLSIYVTPFPSPVNFAHNKRRIVDYYGEYVRLMDHWRKVIPANRLLEVDYEDLVADKETEARRIVDFLNLPWSERCMRHEQNQRTVRTPSLWQVRQPIYRSSVGRWRDYEPWLGELLESVPRAEESGIAR